MGQFRRESLLGALEFGTSWGLDFGLFGCTQIGWVELTGGGGIWLVG